MPSLFERARIARDRLIATQGFRSWAAAFPLTRPIARRRTRALFDLCAGFVYSQVLHACLELSVFRHLADGPLSGEALAGLTGLSAERAARLLDAAVSLRLLARRRGLYALGPLGAALVDNAAIAGMVAHHTMLYADLADPVALLRGEAGQTRLGRFWAYDPQGATPATEAYSRLMAASQSLVAGEILAAFPVGRHRCLMDVGGGDGSFLRRAAESAPDLRLMLFDIPPVAELARARFAESGLAGRATVIGGSFLSDPLPDGADIISLVRVIHDHDDAEAAQILRAARRALPEDGTLLLAEPMAETPGAEPAGHAYFGFYLLAMGRGRPRSAAVLEAMLLAAGFARVRQIPTRTPLLVRVLVAHCRDLPPL